MIGHSATSLYAALNQHLIDINQEIESKQHQRDTDGSSDTPLEPLLIAKAQLLNGMAVLKAADVNSKIPPTRRR